MVIRAAKLEFVAQSRTRANFEQHVASTCNTILVRDKLVRNEVIRPTEGFNLQCDNAARQGAFSIYKQFRKISIGNSGNFRLGKEHKFHSFTSPSPSLHQKKNRCLGKLFCYFLERVFVRRFPVKQMLIIGMCGYEKSDICMFPSF